MGDVTEGHSEHGFKLAFQAKELEELLDVIDGLRRQGITAYVDLPQLVVCGDQSSGKSSVLEALSGVKFPVDGNLCTRFPMEIILRRKEAVSTTISIVPDVHRTDAEQIRLREFSAGVEALEDFGALVEEAGQTMGLRSNNAKAFCADILRVELAGPSLPHLTLVDLPGLYYSSDKGQKAVDSKVVKDLVQTYIKRQRSIILTIVAAKNNPALQGITNYAREVDPRGERTLGIITMPDLLPEGSSNEETYAQLAENKVKNLDLHLGWHALRNRSFQERDSSLEERNRLEAKFFAKGIWARVNPNYLGVGSLNSRLSRVLRDHIRNNLPSLTKDIEAGIKECEGRLKLLGVSRTSVKEQRMYLLQLSQNFTDLVRGAVSGHYSDEFFDESSPIGYPKRILAVVQNILQAFTDDMKTKGHKYVIVEELIPENETVVGNGNSCEAAVEPTYPIKTTKEQRLTTIADLIQGTRGRELPGFAKFETVTTLFKEQCQPWDDLVKAYAEEIFEAVQEALYLALGHKCDITTKNNILHFLVNPALVDIKADLDRNVEHNLRQHMKGHPITFNHYFAKNVQELRNQHQAEFLRPRVWDFFRTNGSLRTTMTPAFFEVEKLIQALTNNTTVDANRFTCSESLHFMEAYYKVAIMFFIDDFSIHTISQGLLEKLESIFNAERVLRLGDSELKDIAGESEESKIERESLSTKMAALKKALETLRDLDRGRTSNKNKLPIRNTNGTAHN